MEFIRTVDCHYRGGVGEMLADQRVTYKNICCGSEMPAMVVSEVGPRNILLINSEGRFPVGLAAAGRAWRACWASGILLADFNPLGVKPGIMWAAKTLKTSTEAHGAGDVRAQARNLITSCRC